MHSVLCVNCANNHLSFYLTHTFFLVTVPISKVSTSPSTVLFAQDDMPTGKPVERGVSVDQDGKSNVWALEPKVYVSTDTSEEKTQSALLAGGGLIAFTAAAGFILTNLPDPNQF
jgi:hypothetical protein